MAVEGDCIVSASGDGSVLLHKFPQGAYTVLIQVILNNHVPGFLKQLLAIVKTTPATHSLLSRIGRWTTLWHADHLPGEELGGSALPGSNPTLKIFCNPISGSKCWLGGQCGVSNDSLPGKSLQGWQDWPGQELLFLWGGIWHSYICIDFECEQ